MKEAKTTQKYKRKTKDCYAIEGNCGYGGGISNAIAKIPLMQKGSCGLIRTMLDIR